MSELPRCDYRVTTRDPAVFFCRHTKVHAFRSLVSGEVCRTCTYHRAECAHPREVPDVDPLPAPVAPGRRPPPMPVQFWNAAKALAMFVADRFNTVTPEQYESRLAICERCPERVENTCLQCGCKLDLKARGRAFDCPLKKWPGVK